jgi:hypothetical protein
VLTRNTHTEELGATDGKTQSRQAAYAAANRHDVTKLVLSEAPIPDPSIYQFSALTANGPGLWNFGFFNVSNGLPEDTVKGREAVRTTPTARLT